MSDSPQGLNPQPVVYPSVPQPSQDVASLQAAINRLIEGYNMLTGQTGIKSRSIAEGLTEIRKQVGANNARMLELNEIQVDDVKALVQRTTILEVEVHDARGTYGTLGGRITAVQTVVGDASSGLVKATNDLTLEVHAARGTYGSLDGRISAIQTVVGDASSGLVQAVNSVVLEVTTARGTYGTLNARISDVQTVVGDASSGLVKATSDLTLEVTTARNGQSTLHNYLSIVDTDVNNVKLKYGVQGTINGVTGGFIFSGIEKNDGSVTYDLEITANVIIHGNLLIDGTVIHDKVTNNAITQTANAAAVGSCGFTITLRGSGPIELTGTWDGDLGGISGTGTFSPGNMYIKRSPTGAGTWTTVRQVANNFWRDTTYIYNPTGGGSITPTQNFSHTTTPIVWLDNPGAGTWDYQLSNDIASNFLIFVGKELSK